MVQNTPSFFERLEKRAREIDSLLCVGLDPHGAKTAQEAFQICIDLVEQTKGLALAYKPNCAFFERFGAEGWSALKTLLDFIPSEIPVVLDAKRGDISSTAQAYADAVFETLGADAVTINPYLGRDSIEPFINEPQHGAFLLCKTSNPGSGDFQDLILADGKTVFEMVALKAQTWNRGNNVGLVVGATYPQVLRHVRRLVPEMWFLTPGVGAQGGEVLSALQAGLREDGLGMLVPVSRGISHAADPRQAALDLVEAMRAAQKQAGNTQAETIDGVRERFAKSLLTSKCVRFGKFTLKSGLESPIYIDLRLLSSQPVLLRDAAVLYLQKMETLSYDVLAGIPYAGLPLATAVSLMGEKRLIYPRKEVKAYGSGAAVEGVFQPGEKAVVLDDLATTGSSKFEAFQTLEKQGLVIKDVVVLIDRQSGAQEALKEAGYDLYAVFTLTELLSIWKKAELISAETEQQVRDFLKESV